MMSVITWLQHNWIIAVVAVFVLIVITTYWPGCKARIERHGQIPLEDDR